VPCSAEIYNNVLRRWNIIPIGFRPLCLVLPAYPRELRPCLLLYHVQPGSQSTTEFGDVGGFIQQQEATEFGGVGRYIQLPQPATEFGTGSRFIQQPTASTEFGAVGTFIQQPTAQEPAETEFGAMSPFIQRIQSIDPDDNRGYVQRESG